MKFITSTLIVLLLTNTAFARGGSGKRAQMRQMMKEKIVILMLIMTTFLVGWNANKVFSEQKSIESYVADYVENLEIGESPVGFTILALVN